MAKRDGMFCWTNSATWMRATRRSSSGCKRRHAEVENLYHALEQRGYQLCLFHPGQTHQFHQRQGLRAKTDRLDAMTIARVLRSFEARSGSIRSRTSGNLSRIGAPAEPIECGGSALPKSDPCCGGRALPRVLPGEGSTVLADGLSHPQSLPPCSGGGAGGPSSPGCASACPTAPPLWTSDRQDTAQASLDFRRQWSSGSRSLAQLTT